ncbi:SOS response-associated peptidase family protein [Variovorax sp. J22G73]|uniref:SOS response-associated peptidase n=1 Tax=unclassified Variovorax TaxID=663243 RepID=UPI002578F5D4|nr:MULTISPECIES: SOS response-associated peptidase family protein [unclassified Variovorax]MDM0007907.1 SOS response-associated peptidase family protein [Variovorax sp. J22R203]MDM0100470.1 SOS response-associated peptidase family protein [Variovorax sp. J22G73]
MCNRYISPETAEAERFWRIKESNSRRPLLPPVNVFPRAQAPFIRRARNETGYERELVIGQWGLIPWFAKEPKLKFPTNNARSEELEQKASYKDPWKRGQRCIIPAISFDEPNWESGKNQWWQFRRADGTPWGLAGLWSTWTDKTTGEVHESYTMLTLNADDHPLMNRMHKPEIDKDTKLPLPADKQDKRSVIPIEFGDVDMWLAGTVQEAKTLLRLAPVEEFDAGPAPASAPAVQQSL